MNGTATNKKEDKTLEVVDTIVLVLLGVIIVASFLANGLVLRVFKKKSSLLRSATNKLLCSCASSDLASAFVAFLNFVSSFSNAIIFPRTSLAYSYRVFVDLLTTTLQLSTLFHICLMTLDRYFALCFALRYRVIVNGGRVKKAIIISWLLAFLVSFSQISWLYRVFDGHINTEDAEILDRIEWRYSIATMSLMVSVPLLLNSAMYFHMYTQARKLLKNPATNQEPGIKQEMVTMWIYFSMAFLTWLSTTPYFALRIIIDLESVHGKATSVNLYALHFMFAFRYIIHFSNPLIFSIKKKDIREATHNYLKSLISRESEGTIYRV